MCKKPASDVSVYNDSLHAKNSILTWVYTVNHYVSKTRIWRECTQWLTTCPKLDSNVSVHSDSLRAQNATPTWVYSDSLRVQNSTLTWVYSESLPYRNMSETKVAYLNEMYTLYNV